MNDGPDLRFRYSCKEKWALHHHDKFDKRIQSFCSGFHCYFQPFSVSLEIVSNPKKAKFKRCKFLHLWNRKYHKTRRISHEKLEFEKGSAKLWRPVHMSLQWISKNWNILSSGQSEIEMDCLKLFQPSQKQSFVCWDLFCFVVSVWQFIWNFFNQNSFFEMFLRLLGAERAQRARPPLYFALSRAGTSLRWTGKLWPLWPKFLTFLLGQIWQNDTDVTCSYYQKYTACKISAQKLHFQNIGSFVKFTSIIEAKYETFCPHV